MLKSPKPESWTRRVQALILCFKQIITMLICMCGQGLLAKNGALLPPCGFQESSVGYQAFTYKSRLSSPNPGLCLTSS